MSDPANSNEPRKTVRKTPPPSPAALAYTPDQVAMITPFSRSVVFELLKSGELPSFKKLGHRYVMRSDLEEFMRRRNAA